jgi:hypothetical protein
VDIYDLAGGYFMPLMDLFSLRIQGPGSRVQGPRFLAHDIRGGEEDDILGVRSSSSRLIAELVVKDGASGPWSGQRQGVKQRTLDLVSRAATAKRLTSI